MGFVRVEMHKKWCMGMGAGECAHVFISLSCFVPVLSVSGFLKGKRVRGSDEFQIRHFMDLKMKPPYGLLKITKRSKATVFWGAESLNDSR